MAAWQLASYSPTPTCGIAKNVKGSSETQLPPPLFFLKIWFSCVSLAVLELSVDQAGLKLSDLPPCDFFLSAGIKGVHHHCPEKDCNFLFCPSCYLFFNVPWIHSTLSIQQVK